MPNATYLNRRGQLEAYFDRTAMDAWKRLTSDAPVSRIRATVRAGRDEMRATLLSYLPADLTGRRVLDAGCGTGALAVEAARRGAEVVAIDLSANLVNIAAERVPHDLGAGRIDFRVGDAFDAGLGSFDHIVAMDSLIHYPAREIVRILGGFAARAGASLVFTFAPSSLFLQSFITVGKLFPRGDRSPAIEPVAAARLARMIGHDKALAGWRIGRSRRIARGFYTSQAMELHRA
jgi:magnesium-protoporphyrin O-methyltransferase